MIDSYAHNYYRYVLLALNKTISTEASENSIYSYYLSK